MPNIKRLKRLVTVLERVRASTRLRREFDLSKWSLETKTCGTHHCALGWGAVDPVLKKQGLSFSHGDKIRRGLVRAVIFNPNNLPDYDPDIKWGYQASSAFFDITDQESAWLFSPGAYKDKKNISTVINRLNGFIEMKVVGERLG